MSLSARRTTRRRFVAAGLAATLAGARLPSSRAHGANERFQVGVIGTGVRGKFLVGNLPDSVDVVAICDTATSNMADTLAPRGRFKEILDRFRRTSADGCLREQDYRRLLDRAKLDAVIIATPDHHHALPAMLALDSGRHVYLEKPMTLTISEGRRIVNAVERTGRVLQVGSQQRTMEINRFGCEFVRDGGLGRITSVELPNYPGPIDEPRFPTEPAPRGLDWDLFCGPAPLRPHNRKLWVKDAFKVGDLVWRGWDLFRDYSGHLATNWGAHSVDMVQYALGRDDTGPVSIRPEPFDSAQAVWTRWSHKTPAPRGSIDRRFQPVTMRYADGVELRFVNGPDPVVFHGERGTMRMRRNFFETDPPSLVGNAPGPEVARLWAGDGHVARPHLENWLDAIRGEATVNAPAEIGHRSVTVCHLVNLVRELNRELRWDPSGERFVNDDEANQLLDRPRRTGFELPT